MKVAAATVRPGPTRFHQIRPVTCAVSASQVMDDAVVTASVSHLAAHTGAERRQSSDMRPLSVGRRWSGLGGMTPAARRPGWRHAAVGLVAGVGSRSASWGSRAI